MKELFGSLVKLILVFVIAAIVIYDIGGYFYTRYYGQQKADEVARVFATEYKQSASTGSAVAKATETANILGVAFRNYNITQTSVEVVIELELEKTVIINRVEALKPYSKVKISAGAQL